MNVVAMSLGRVLSVLIVLALGGLIVPATGSAEVPIYRLGPGDKLRITVAGQEDLSGQFEIDDGGAVTLALVGSVRIGGLALPKARETIVSAYRPDYLVEPEIRIKVLNYRPIYVLGEVINPGTYPYKSNLTVSRAVELAGGFTDQARRDRLTVVRADDRRQEKFAVTVESKILPGDIVEVRKQLF